MEPGKRNGRHGRILVVGEDTLYREGLCQLLRDLPDPVRIDRADRLEETPEPLEGLYDLVFLSVLPPGVDCAAAIRAAKAKAGRTAVAVVGQVDTPSTVRRAMGAGASGFLPTSSSPKVVLHAAELMLSGGVYLPPSLLGAANQPRAANAEDIGPVRLTHRQETVLQELAKGQSNKQIASALGLSEATVKVHVAAIMKSLKAQNRTHAVLAATQAGILPDRPH